MPHPHAVPGLLRRAAHTAPAGSFPRGPHTPWIDAILLGVLMLGTIVMAIAVGGAAHGLPEAVAAPPAGETLREVPIRIDARGVLAIGKHTFDLASGDPRIRDDAIVAVRTAVRRIHDERPGVVLRGEPIPQPWPADRVVVIHAHDQTPCEYVALVISALHHPELQPPRIQYAVQAP